MNSHKANLEYLAKGHKAGSSELNKYKKSQEYEMLSEDMREEYEDAITKDQYAIIFKGKRPLDGGKVPFGLDLDPYLTDDGDLSDQYTLRYYDTDDEFEEAYK